MKLIFQIITSISPGGAENISFLLSEYFVKNTNDLRPVIFELYKTDSAYASQKKEQLKELGIEFHTLGVKNKYISLLTAPFALRKYIRKLNPAIVHSHTDLPDFVLSIALRLISKAKFTIIRTIHNTELWPTHDRMGKLTEKSFRNDTIIAVSDAALASYNKLRKKYNLSPSNYQHTVYNGIKAPALLSFPYSFDTTKINIAFAGRLEVQKGVDIFLALLQNCPQDIASKVVFHIIGDGTYRKEAEETCLKYENCIYHGVVSDLSSKLSSFDYIIMPSRHEGLVLMSLEASFAKVPVIASAIPGLAETLPADWPLFAQSVTTGGFLELLEKIADNKINKTELKEKAFQYASHHFSFDRMGKEYLAILKTEA